MTTPVQQGLNFAQAGTFRIPALLVSATGVAAVGEIAYRVLSSIAGLVFSQPQWVKNTTAKVHEKTGLNLRPFAKYNAKQLAITALVGCTLGVLATDLATHAFGKAPAIYNNVLSYISPLRLDSSLYFSSLGA